MLSHGAVAASMPSMNGLPGPRRPSASSSSRTRGSSRTAAGSTSATCAAGTLWQTTVTRTGSPP